MKRRIERNLVLLFLGCAALPLVVVAVIGYVGSTRSVRSMVQRRTSFSCVEIDEKFTREMARRKEHFLLTAYGAGVLPPEWESRARPTATGVEFYASDLQSAGLEDTYAGFVFLDTGGKPLSRIDYQGPPGPGVFLRGYALQTVGSRAGQPADTLDAVDPASGEVGVLLPLPDAGTMVVRLTYPLYADGAWLGTIVGEVDAGTILESIVGGVSLGKDAYHFILDSRTDVVLFHPDYSKRNQLMHVALPHLGRRPFRDRSDGWLEFRAGDERWIVAHRQIAGTPWTVAVASPLGVFLAPIHRVGQISLILVLVVLSAASTGIFLGTRRFRHSLASLTDASEAFSAGDLERRVRVSTEDEMGALGQAFNRMAQQLRAQIDRREENAGLESFNRLSAAVAHDLKGTLFSLSLLVENMDRHSGDPQFLRDSAETIRSTVERMKKISAKLSERRPRAELERRHVDLAVLLRRALRESGADGRDDVRVETDLSGVPEISADPAQIERLFLNLLHNALEAMPEGGTLRLTATMPQPGWVAVQLEDTGMGMSSEFTEQQLFRPFSSTKSGGIGLGLYTGKQIVEHHGGRIEVSSRPSQGTRFTVHLPSTAPEVG